jgi:YbbR domain-containing protein
MNESRSYKLLIGSFIVSVLFWIVVNLNAVSIARFAVPLSVVNLPDDVAIANPLPDNIDVVLRGTGWQLLYLSLSNQLTFEIPGQRIRSDRMLLTSKIMAEAVKLPSGVTAMQVFPETLSIVVDRFVLKKVPLVIDISRVTFKAGFGLSGPPSVNPDSIFISGAERNINGITAWSTAPFSASDLSQSVSEEVGLKDSLEGVVHFNRNTVLLTMTVSQLVDVPFTGIPVTVVGVPPGLEVILGNPTITIHVRGGLNQLDTLDSRDFSASVDYQTILRDTTGSVLPRIPVPPGVTVLSVNPPRLKYVIRR